MRRTVDRDFGQRLLRVVCIILLLALLAGILLTEAQRSKDAVGREIAEIRTYTHTDTLEGYVFREEVALPSSNNGPIEYLVSDGGAVLAGQELANVYTGGQGGTAQRDEAAVIYAEIDRLEKALEEDVVAWQLSYADSYSSLMEAIGKGDWQIGLNAAEELSDTLEKRSVLTGDGEAVRVRIATLRAQAEELSRHEEKQLFKAPMSGYFSTATDGYEALFGTAAVDNLTPEGLDLLLASDLADTDVAVQNIGKLVSAGRFYFAVPLSSEQAACYVVGADYRVRMTRGGVSTMQLTRVALSADGGAALLLLCAERIPAGMDFARRQPLVIERESVTGIAVPSSALISENGVDFVYILRDGVAAKRRVEILCAERGCCIVASDKGEGYLATGENILITSRSLYEGRELS